MKISFEVDGEVMGMPRPRSTIVNGHVRVYETKESSENKAYIRMAYRDARSDHGGKGRARLRSDDSNQKGLPEVILEEEEEGRTCR